MKMDIQDIWMRLEALSHLRDYGPRLKALHDKIAKELEDHSASLEAKPVATVGLVTPVSSPTLTRPEQEQADARRESARKSLETTAGVTGITQPTIGAPDKTDAEKQAESPETVERRI